MSLQYIIDGYNLINHSSFRQFSQKSNKDSRLALLELIKSKRLCGSLKNKVTVVFDGYPDRDMSISRQDNTEVIFSKKETADEKIKKITQAQDNPRNTVVVSDDREIKFFVKSIGSRCLGIEEFIGTKEKAAPLEMTNEIKSELTYTQMQKINQELKKIWLK